MCHQSHFKGTPREQTAVTPAWLRQTATPLQCCQNEASFPRQPTDRKTKTTPILWKNPQKKEFQDSWIPGHTLHWFFHLLQITLARLGTISTCPITDNSPQTKKGLTSCKWLLMNFQNEGNNLPGAPRGQLRCHSFLVPPGAQGEARTDTPQTRTPRNQGADSPDIWYFLW